MDLGIDIGTSEVKAVLVDDGGRVVGQAASALPISRPHPLWSEQDPRDWWHGDASPRSARCAPRSRGAYAAVRGLGLSGQMHGATLLDAHDRVLRPAILWNDGRSAPQCAELERRVAARAARITGNIAMPGFTAPKLLWVARARARVLSRRRARAAAQGLRAAAADRRGGVRHVRCGRHAVARRRAARRGPTRCSTPRGLTRAHMPRLVEGSADARHAVRPQWPTSSAWPRGRRRRRRRGRQRGERRRHRRRRAGQRPSSRSAPRACTSSPTPPSRPTRQRAVHAFCHCLPRHLAPDERDAVGGELPALAAHAHRRGQRGRSSSTKRRPLALERRVADLPALPVGRAHAAQQPARERRLLRPHARRAGARTWRCAVLEGVAFAFADGQQALLDGGARIEQRRRWSAAARAARRGRSCSPTCSAGRSIGARGGEVGAALGAARLARAGAQRRGGRRGLHARRRCVDRFEPDPPRGALLAERHRRFQRLYAALADRRCSLTTSQASEIP